MGRFFGTDGFRGEANKGLTAAHAFRLGRYLGSKGSCGISEEEVSANSIDKGSKIKKRRIVIGMDTRISSKMFESALAAGISASGADVYLTGVMTTPSVSYITKTCGFDYGVMISASHNPYQDNGLKVINIDGSKINDVQIEEIEKYLSGEGGELEYAVGADIGVIRDYPEGRELYKRYLIDIAKAENIDLSGKKIALDMANGSASGLAAEIFTELGATVTACGDRPDGVNINAGVGSTHIDNLCRIVKENACDIGFAYDGDADRCLASDENGSEVNGDQLIYACAIDLKRRGLLKDDTAVLTVMSNLGTFKALEKAGIKYAATKVGDRFVWEEMEKNGYKLGGEQSGHIIFADNASTGDGILTSLKVMGVMCSSKKKASGLFDECRMYPQVLKNVRVVNKDAAMENAALKEAVNKAESMLSGSGRVLVRKSGTEPVIRVMAEAKSYEDCQKACDEVINIMETEGLTV